MFQRVPRLSKVYFCIPLRCGVIILVYLNLLLAGGAIVVFGWLDFFKMLARIFSGSRRFKVPHMNAKFRANSDLFLYTLLVYAASEIAMTIVVLIGIHRRKVRLIKVYLHFTVVLTIYMFVMRIFDLQFSISRIDIVSALIYTLAKVYYILAIRSLVKRMDENDATERKMSSDVEMRSMADEEAKVLDESMVNDVTDEDNVLIEE